MTLRTALLIAALASPATAEAPLTAEAFDAMTQGQTMTWAEYGEVYGVERYLPNRQVRWTVLGDDCVAGHWYPDGEAICFQYEDRPDPVCWTITATDTGLAAQLVGDPPEILPVVIEPTTAPMACFGPEVGA